jgi:FHS family L-fucose permease-like MFS transporter
MNYRKSFSLLTSLFFMWGFITVMNDLLINTFKQIFELSTFQAGLVQFAFFGAYFIISLLYFILTNIFTEDPINKIGYKIGMVWSLVICGVGCMLFYPAALISSYSLFLSALFVLASGVTLLQICANPYAAIMGTKESASSRLNFAQGFNSLGTTVGPLLGAILIYRVFSNGDATVASVGKVYLIYGIVFILAAIIMFFSKMPSFSNNEKIEKGLGILNHKPLIFGVLAIFFYVGGEVAIGSFIIPFAKDVNIMNMSDEKASFFLSYYWGGAMIGRLMGAVSLNNEMSNSKKYALMAVISVAIFIFIYTVTGIKPSDDGGFSWSVIGFDQVFYYLIYMLLNFAAFYFGKGKPALTLAIFSAFVLLLLGISSFGSGEIAFWSLLGIGLFNSIMWSNIFTLAIKDLGKYTGQGSSLLIMAVVGGAIIPPLQGLLVDKIGIQLSFLLPALCYLYLLYYGLAGSNVKTEKSFES